MTLCCNDEIISCIKSNLSHLVIILLINVKIGYYYWFNRKDLLKKHMINIAKEGGKEIAAIYYQRNKEDIKKKQRDMYKNFKRRKRSDKKKISRKIL